MVRAPEDHPWSSARAHLSGRDDALVKVAPLLRMAADWKAFLASGLDAREHAALRSHERTGRPLGGEAFLTRLEGRLGRNLKKSKPGRKPAAKANKQGVP